MNKQLAVTRRLAASFGEISYHRFEGVEGWSGIVHRDDDLKRLVL